MRKSLQCARTRTREGLDFRFVYTRLFGLLSLPLFAFISFFLVAPNFVRLFQKISHVFRKTWEKNKNISDIILSMSEIFVMIGFFRLPSRQGCHVLHVQQCSVSRLFLISGCEIASATAIVYPHANRTIGSLVDYFMGSISCLLFNLWCDVSCQALD